ncbi:MAG TPA: trehalase family glycosidase [Chloroflexota bacterium]|nr:trehalase family glycosidase [Chloroflexota bacterium]
MTVGAEMEQLLEGAKRVLHGNDLGGWTKPAPNLYPHQWNWDSCFIAIGLSHLDTARAVTEIHSLLRGQWANGMVPQIVFNPAGQGYFPGPDVWQSTRSPDAPHDVMTSGISQPPVLAIACRAIFENAPPEHRDEAQRFLEWVYPRVMAYHRWLYRERNPDGNGLVVVLHPWEGGLDNSPVYLDAGSRVHLTYKPVYHREDTAHVSAQYRPTNKDYDLYVYLLEQMRADDWDQSRYLAHAPLQVQDILFNAILCRADSDLAAIAEIIGENPSEAQRMGEETRAAINSQLWDADRGMYLSRDRVADRLLTDATIEGFMALYGNVAPEDRVRILVDVHLTNPRQFWPAFPVPTTALDSPSFNPQNYWLGPVWVNTNWMIIRGLVDTGRTDRAAQLTADTLELVRRSGYREYYNPYDGAGYGTDNFSWTAALTVDLVTAVNASG